MTRVLVTGANGHLGANIVRSLLRRRHEVVPFIRSTSDLRGLEGLGLTCRYGDIMDAKSLVAAAEGCEVIIHAAAVYRFHAPRPEDLMRPALDGIRNVFAAASAAGARRVIYTSSTFAVGSSSDSQTLRTAEDWNDLLHMPYTKSKVQTERLAWELSRETGMPLIVLCPSGILGPYDYGITPSTGLLRSLVNGQGVTGPGGASFVDVGDVAEVHAAAVDGGEPGQRYVIAGENMTMQAFGDLIGRIAGVRTRHINAGRSFFLAVAGMMELAAKLSGSEPNLTRKAVRELIGRYHYYDCEKTRLAFGFSPRPGEQMVADSIRWLLHLDAIESPVAARLSEQLPPDPRWRASLA